MGFETPKRPEVKVKVPKFTKIELGGDRSDDVRQVEAKKKTAEKVLKELPNVEAADVPKIPKRPEVKSEYSTTPEIELGEARSDDIRQVETKKTAGKKASATKKSTVAEKPKKRGSAS